MAMTEPLPPGLACNISCNINSNQGNVQLSLTATEAEQQVLFRLLTILTSIQAAGTDIPATWHLKFYADRVKIASASVRPGA